MSTIVLFFLLIIAILSLSGGWSKTSAHLPPGKQATPREARTRTSFNYKVGSSRAHSGGGVRLALVGDILGRQDDTQRPGRKRLCVSEVDYKFGLNLSATTKPIQL